MPTDSELPDQQFLVPEEIISRQIAAAQGLRDEWADRLIRLRESGNGRMRLGGVWETMDEAAERMQELIDLHARTIALLSAFRPEGRD